MTAEQLQIDRLRLLAEIDKTIAPDRMSLLQAIEFLESLREDIAIRLEALDTREGEHPDAAR